ncbi:MAG: hypothetical protein ACK2U1_01950 [Anaerolineales bacterium]
MLLTCRLTTMVQDAVGAGFVVKDDSEKRNRIKNAARAWEYFESGEFKWDLDRIGLENVDAALFVDELRMLVEESADVR